MQSIDFRPDFSANKKQSIAYRVLQEPGIRELLYGGAKGGGKSWFGCNWMMIKAMDIIETFKLPKTRHPIALGVMARKQGSDFRKTTLETWAQTIPPELYRLNKQTNEIVILDRVKFFFGGFDRQESINKFNSAEYALFFVDQAEELDKDDVMILRGAMRLKINGKDMPRKGLFTANPAQCFLKDEFITAPTESRRFIPALPSDNPYLPGDYVETLRDAFRQRPELLRAYLYGDWSAISSPGQVIQSDDVEAARAKLIVEAEAPICVSCDPARFGDDSTMIYVMQGSTVLREVEETSSNLYQLAMELCGISDEFGDCPIIVDETGIGGGVIDAITSTTPHYCIPINSGSKANKPEKYGNLRAQMWENASSMFALGAVSLGSGWSEKLHKDLTAPQYKYRNGRMYIEEKDAIKKRLGRSPDRGDCYVQGLWANNVLLKNPFKPTSTQYFIDTHEESESQRAESYV